ncbi:MAG: hypothetical protein AYL28_000880 [Candidatus Bathyarchaeota archaeon B23]|nr:MAG: hypothetical protein AYL28_000880 [Candidatus Bathyarchaeota archaeon B23]
MRVYTIGHSNRSLDEFLGLLEEYGIEAVVDVRRWPTSSRYPHFNGERLCEALEGRGVEYLWLGDVLGGYRRRGLGEASPNKGWSRGGFRNYADYALTEEFRRGLRRTLELAGERRTAIMCSERFYWRCHRRIISDHLLARGVEVIHIIDRGKTRRHRLTRFAVIQNGVPIYPPEGGEQTKLAS